MAILLRAAMIASVAALAAGVWWDGRLPEPQRLVPDLRQEPVQRATRKAPFTTTVGGVEYKIAPQYDYELRGLVVSQHHADAWWDWVHAAFDDHLNVMDLCVVWGDNAASGVYRDVSFRNGQWTCEFSIPSQLVYQAFKQHQISNNHLLVDSPQLTRRIKRLRVGDQVLLKGYLAEYRHNSQGRAFFRGTSTTRTDTGNGACETLYVTEAQVLRSAPASGRRLFWTGALGVLISLAIWVALPHRGRG